MMLEAVGNAFTYRWPGGEVHLTPGQAVVLPEDRARRLLAKAGGRVRRVELPVPVVGRIQWRSPLFGDCQGTVVFGPESDWYCVRTHSVSGSLALVHESWIVR